ncbi:MAG: GlsB/YeaQ/YmgE family stress response membrane protein [Actinobacteria bacterium HGW-Actinobacteria-4]|nr:MAG: GlsB/YeaQ/YmgE family stress response membrane protein [Actinobacteria bacterium HGW-Actinobacteria-4]
MDILILILIGAIVGFLGQLVAGRSVHWLLSIVIGIVGVFLGFYLWGAIAGGDSVVMGYVMGVVVAALLVVLVSRMRGRGARV